MGYYFNMNERSGRSALWWLALIVPGIIFVIMGVLSPPCQPSVIIDNLLSMIIFPISLTAGVSGLDACLMRNKKPGWRVILTLLFGLIALIFSLVFMFALAICP